MKSRFIVFLVIPLCCLIILQSCIRPCVENENIYSQYKDFEEIRNARFRQENRSYSSNHHNTNTGRQIVSPVRYIKQKPSCEDFFHVCRISQFVQFWISDFGRLQCLFILVDLIGIEPTTSSLRTRRSPS